MTEEERDAERVLNTASHSKRMEELTAEESQAERQRDTVIRAEQKDAMTEAAHQQAMDTNAEAQRARRDTMTDTERQQQNEAERLGTRSRQYMKRALRTTKTSTHQACEVVATTLCVTQTIAARLSAPVRTARRWSSPMKPLLAAAILV
ncbi:hypothetical protein PC110_g19699 [Phytophthora cactorum]|nr:hypothetical protein PC110_g19699 [Phytophthora cactorum]